VNELTYEVHDEGVTFSFYLRSGSFATTFLSYLFNLDGDQDEPDTLAIEQP
jgi:tRNA(Glu) U13 pseudouridine synthase TruD